MTSDPIEQAVKLEQKLRTVEQTRSLWTGSGHLNMGSIQHEIPGASDLSRVPFPERLDPNLSLYGYKHHSETAKLADRVAQELGLSDAERAIVRGAGMLHDLGRRLPWPAQDPGHQERGATIAEQVMREDHQFWGDREAREKICWIIANHRLDGPAPTDPLLVALWDAELYESMRLAPGKIEGVRAMKAALARTITGWAKLPEHQERWRKHHGW